MIAWPKAGEVNTNFVTKTKAKFMQQQGSLIVSTHEMQLSGGIATRNKWKYVVT